MDQDERMIQQGDVQALRIDTLPNNVKKVARKERGYVLAEGETTGHAHVIQDNIEMWEDEQGTLYVNIPQRTILVHEEHGPITFETGIWEIGIVQEVDPISEQIRSIQD